MKRETEVMTTQEGTEQHYTMGYSPEFLEMLERRNAANCAAHLLPRLEAGMKLLDIGCGPGTITMGLAEAVSPGEVHGIDMEESQIHLARAAASAAARSNATFHVGNALSLPFEDESFDVVHAHAVLMHIADTQAALTEAMRVLRPGGILATRDLIAESSFTEPATDGIREMWAVFTGLMQGNGGHPQMGKEMKAIMQNAGFADIRCSASFESYDAPADIAFFYGFALEWFFSKQLIERVTALGIATREQFDFWRSELDRWRDSPHAFGALAFGECVARK